MNLPPVAIVAGGLATRLRPATDTVPKALLEVNGEPFLFHQLRLLRSRGIGRAVLCVGYLGEKVEHAAGRECQGVRIDYSWDGPELRGTAGAIRNALGLLGGEFFALYGDSYLPCDYAAPWRAFRESGKPALMTVYRNDGRWDSSNVEFAGGRILAYDKKVRTPRMRHIDYGLGVFRPEAFGGAESDLADLYRRLLARGELAAWESPERFWEIGSAEGLSELSERLKR